MSNRIPFLKPYTCAHDLVCLLLSRGHYFSPHNDMKAKIDALLSANPSIDINAMGFPRGWENEPLWR